MLRGEQNTWDSGRHADGRRAPSSWTATCCLPRHDGALRARLVKNILRRRALAPAGRRAFLALSRYYAQADFKRAGQLLTGRRLPAGQAGSCAAPSPPTSRTRRTAGGRRQARAWTCHGIPASRTGLTSDKTTCVEDTTFSCYDSQCNRLAGGGRKGHALPHCIVDYSCCRHCSI